MRKIQKRQIEELAEEMEQAHEQVKKYMEQNYIQSAVELLEECQKAAISLGTMIENLEDEGHPTVSFLEEYCELIFQIHEKLTGTEKISPAKANKRLRQQMIRIANSIRNDIRVRREAVFLPYKASMWDSLESVWQAADADPDCDAYVIPIPYYDKGPDGSLQEMHYEAELYPEYVPVIKYDAFDFEAHRPDMIFIHNPYDAANFVTSVHPFFYSDNLKRFTDNLIYIPYFVLREIEPDDIEAVKNIEHFCMVPAILHADKAIVQSEKMRQAYIKALSETAGEESRKVWEEKILGLGSPKFDKIETTESGNFKLPESWLKIIEKPDGSHKKIILYNTSVTALLKNNEKMLEKMKSVFRVFRENQDEAALLWRPHPLTHATINGMRPRLWMAYEKLQKQYIEEEWGIYDDSAELDRAIAVSDAYYGDASSLVQLFQKTGKPVMVQNVEI